MNQDEFLERLWLDVINVSATHDVVLGAVDEWDVRRVARLARYEAVFEVCEAFDEYEFAEGESVEEGLRAVTRDVGERMLGEPWLRLSEAPAGDVPFADADDAAGRLLRAGVPAAPLSELRSRARRAALAGVMTVVHEGKFDHGDLAGLHETLLTADPSGREGRRGSWPFDSSAGENRAGGSNGLLRVLRKSHALAFSPDGERVVAASGGAITEIATGAHVATCRLFANTSHVEWASHGRWIAATSTSGKIAVCDAVTGSRVAELSMECEGAGAMFSHDNRELLAGDWGGNLFVWELTTGRRVRHVSLGDAMVRALVRLANGNVMVLAVRRPSPAFVVIMRGDLASEVARFELPDGTHHVAADPSGTVATIAGRSWIARIELRSGSVSDRCHADMVRAIAHSPDGRWLVVTAKEGFRFGLANDLARGGLHCVEYAYAPAVFSRDSSRVALATWERGEVWDTGSLVHSLGM